jgi:hypothetical protein
MTRKLSLAPKLSLTLWGLAAFLSAGVAAYAYVVLPLGGSPSPGVLANLFARPWLLAHVAGAGTALLVVSLQLLPAIRRRRAIHRWIGRVYGGAVVIGGAAGLALSVGTTAGPVAGLGFGLLAVVWIYVTGQGWLTARARRFDEHRRWMIRSFSLTFAAVTLRIYMPLAGIAGLDMAQAYVAIAWLAWVPNLLVAELYLRRGTLRLQPAV